MGYAPPRILVVEDDDAIRLSVARQLEGEGYLVQAEPDGVQIEQLATSFRPDLALLDVRLQVGPDGYAIARLLRAAGDLAILFLTGDDTIDARMAGFDVGADDYILKPFAMVEVLARIRAVLRRAGRLSSAVAQVADLIVDDSSRQAIRAEARLDLTPTEFELLSALVRQPGRTVSKVQLLEHVWGFDAYDVNLVEVHMSSLRRKVEAHGRRLIHTVRGVGYKLQ